MSRRQIVPNDKANERYRLFQMLWGFIALVSVIDGYLVLEYREDLRELNPYGRILITLNDGDVWYLLGVKFVGTVIAATLLEIIYDNHARLGTISAIAVAGLQLCLLLFLFLK